MALHALWSPCDCASYLLKRWNDPVHTLCPAITRPRNAIRDLWRSVLELGTSEHQIECHLLPDLGLQVDAVIPAQHNLPEEADALEPRPAHQGPPLAGSVIGDVCSIDDVRQGGVGGAEDAPIVGDGAEEEPARPESAKNLPDSGRRLMKMLEHVEGDNHVVVFGL